MYTWGYIKAACLAKLDMTADQAIDMGLMNKFPFYANEAIGQITQAIRAKRSYAEFEVHDEFWEIATLKEKYNLDDMSFLYNHSYDKTECTLNQLKALEEYNKYSYIGKPVRMPKDFIFWGDDRNYQYDDCRHTWYEASDDDFDIIGDNKIMFTHCGKFRISYCAKWFTFLPTTDDNEELNVPDAIIEALPSYIVSQCYKIDDEVKAAYYLNEFEILIARIEDNSYTTNKTMKIVGDW